MEKSQTLPSVPQEFLDAVLRGNPQDVDVHGSPVEADIGGGEVVLVGSYTGVTKVLQSSDSFTNGNSLLPPREVSPAVYGVLAPLFSYPPAIAAQDGRQHRETRYISRQVMPPRSRPPAQTVGPQVASTLQEWFGQVQSGQEVDMAPLAHKIAMDVLCATTGIDPQHEEQLHRATYEQAPLLWGYPAPPEDEQVRAAQAAVDILEICRSTLEHHEGMPPAERPENITTRLLAYGGLSTKERISALNGIVNAGYKTTALALGNVLVRVLSTEGAWRDLADSPDKVEPTISKGLETDTSVHGWYRTVSPDASVEERTVGGIELAAGSRLLLLFASANRDTARPAGGRDLTFSPGAHRCLGDTQAAYVIGAAVRRLATSFPNMRLAAGPEAVVRKADLAFNGPTKVMVQLGGQAASH